LGYFVVNSNGNPTPPSPTVPESYWRERQVDLKELHGGRSGYKTLVDADLDDPLMSALVLVW
jgi:hypothetical protein